MIQLIILLDFIPIRCRPFVLAATAILESDGLLERFGLLAADVQGRVEIHVVLVGLQGELVFY